MWLEEPVDPAWSFFQVAVEERHAILANDLLIVFVEVGPGKMSGAFKLHIIFRRG